MPTKHDSIGNASVEIDLWHDGYAARIEGPVGHRGKRHHAHLPSVQCDDGDRLTTARDLALDLADYFAADDSLVGEMITDELHERLVGAMILLQGYAHQQAVE